MKGSDGARPVLPLVPRDTTMLLSSKNILQSLPAPKIYYSK